MIKNDDIQVTARKMADIILNESTGGREGLAENIQSLLGYVNDQRDRHPAAVTLVEAMLQNVFEALEPDQAIL